MNEGGFVSVREDFARAIQQEHKLFKEVLIFCLKEFKVLGLTNAIKSLEKLQNMNRVSEGLRLEKEYKLIKGALTLCLQEFKVSGSTEASKLLVELQGLDWQGKMDRDYEALKVENESLKLEVEKLKEQKQEFQTLLINVQIDVRDFADDIVREIDKAFEIDKAKSLEIVQK